MSPDKLGSHAERASRVILVVDDDDAVRTVVRNVLEHAGYSVIEANDGAQALVLVEAFGAVPDLIISDIMMPEVNGGELVRELTRDGHAPRVLLMSGLSDKRVREVIGVGDTPFIAKPFTVEEMQRRVAEMLGP